MNERESHRSTPAFARQDEKVTRVIYEGPFSGVNAAVELRCWRLFGADVMPFLEAALAAQGDTPDGKLLCLQHALVELLRSPATHQQERIIQT